MHPSPAYDASSEDRRRLDGAFVHCADCSAVHRITTSDGATRFLADGTAADADDYLEFLGAHLDHRLELLRRSSDAEIITHPRWDPMCRVAWEVSDGEHGFVVISGRSDVDGPRQYAIAPGRMALEVDTIDLEDDTLRRLIDEALYPHAAPLAKIERVVAACRERLAATPKELVEPVAESRDEPGVQLACLPIALAAGLAAEVHRLFADPDRERLLVLVTGDLVHEIPTIRVTRRYTICS
jgi:hypothetical protein